MFGSITNTALETLLKAYFSLDPDITPQLKSLAGKIIQIELKGLNMHFTILFTNSGLQVLDHYEGKVDATIRGTPIGLIRLGIMSNASSQFFAEDVEISGDTELGQAVKELFDNLDIDWEEHFSHLVGDMFAHQAGNAIRSTLNWGQKTQESMRANLSEFIHEEIRFLPPPEELEDFYEDIDELRDNVERLATRVAQLKGSKQ